ncbi:uncharacterized protein LOC127278189 [Leptopilina boulardi]|uniref:uncharacterized protein LOC127278189 n=1 Tax=Leptopilina boulardi TaxID=63433 RepID=UPI0021F512B9|nr:uncharacterized protein LOC127278189 [Leptopilina boulardi]
MFRAMSFILWDTENNHKQLRTVVVEHIHQNWNEYGPFVIAEWNISSRQDYFDYMIADGTFASELECTVLTKLYRMNLSIYREIVGGGILKIIFHNRLNRNYSTARLLFSGESDVGHYDVLILLSDD